MKLEQRLASILEECQKEIQSCDEKIAEHKEEIQKLEKRKRDLTSSFHKAVHGVDMPAKAKSGRPSKEEGLQSVSSLIMECINANGGSASSQQIKQYLAEHGRPVTNPGVELGRMCDGEQIERVKRGVYAKK